MDWQSVTTEDLLEAFKEVDWKSPRPVGEFFSKFSPPKNASKWLARLKCNTYYYRTNYLVLSLFVFVCTFLRNPLALLAIKVGSLAFLCLNDPFAVGISDTILKAVRKIHPRTAQRLRAAIGENPTTVPLSRARRHIRILGYSRKKVVLVLAAAAVVLFYFSAGVKTLAWALLLGLGLPLLHATLRAPNLKARLASAKEEFRATWRGYQMHDYTL